MVSYLEGDPRRCSIEGSRSLSWCHLEHEGGVLTPLPLEGYYIRELLYSKFLDGELEKNFYQSMILAKITSTRANFDHRNFATNR